MSDANDSTQPGTMPGTGAPAGPPQGGGAPPAAGGGAGAGGAGAPPAGASPPPKADPMRAPVASPAVDRLKARFPEQVEEIAYYAGEAIVRLRKERLDEVLRFLRDDPDLRFDYLSNLTAVHWPSKPKQFEVVYHLFSIGKRHRVTLKLEVADGEEAPTACAVWPTANWHEREVFDLFGIRFTGHPDMTRILMTDEWVGHPLRKDYPLEGKPEDHVQYRDVTTAEHVYRFDKAPIKGFGWRKEVEKTGEGRG